MHVKRCDVTRYNNLSSNRFVPPTVPRNAMSERTRRDAALHEQQNRSIFPARANQCAIVQQHELIILSIHEQVKAYDADTPPYNDQVRYFLKEGDTDLFRINASTGDISLLRPLDRELMPEYTLTLVAMDTGELPSSYLRLFMSSDVHMDTS